MTRAGQSVYLGEINYLTFVDARRNAAEVQVRSLRLHNTDATNMVRILDSDRSQCQRERPPLLITSSFVVGLRR